MLLRRIAQHLRDQNWFAVALDLLVVVLGIFLAFQVERWYEGQRLKAQEGVHLAALLKDFREAKSDLDWMIERFDNAKKAAQTLINLDRSNASEIDGAEFYRLIAESQRNANLEPRRQTYDSLVATGAIESLSDESLKQELGAYFAYVERFLASRGRWDLEVSQLWEPFVLNNLDRSMLIRASHPSEANELRPYHSKEQYADLIGADELRSVAGKRWHFYNDRAFGLKELRSRTEALEALIQENYLRR